LSADSALPHGVSAPCCPLRRRTARLAGTPSEAGIEGELADPFLDGRCSTFRLTVERPIAGIAAHRFGGEDIVVDLADGPAETAQIGQGEKLVDEGGDGAGEVRIGH